MTGVKHVFAGFGFGPIQAGLFAYEAARSGWFSEIAVAEVDPALVAAVRRNGDRYTVNIAWPDRVERAAVDGVRLHNTADPADAARFRDALARATEMVTSLPSVDFYIRGGCSSVASLIAEGLGGSRAPQAVIYTAENNNHAAERLEQAVRTAEAGAAPGRPACYLNTVIGKMSQVVCGEQELARRGLTPIAPGLDRAFLVESFSRILVSTIRLKGFEPGLRAFEQKSDLLPFEEAKLYGHNAVHTLLGFLGEEAGARLLPELRDRPSLLALARRAFVEEVGAALVTRYGALGDPLFTEAGFAAYADDLLARMTNPHLADSVARATRDPLRKLGCSDRLFGAVRLCLASGVEPACLAQGACAGLRALAARGERPAGFAWPARAGAAELDRLLASLWGPTCPAEERAAVAAALARAVGRKRA